MARAQDRQWADQRPPGNGGMPDGMSSGMQISIEKYLDMRFAHIEENIKELRSDLREIRGFKLWIVGTGVATLIAIIGIMIAFYSYHANIMQSRLTNIQSQMSLYQSQLNSQMQTFSDYVKAVTQSQPTKEKKPFKK